MSASLQSPESQAANGRVFHTDPLKDSRWRQLVLKSPKASVFHTPGWLEALQRTYGYRPVLLTTCGPEVELTNGLVAVRIESRVTGRRLVSVPFADHCEPVADSAEEARILLAALRSDVVESGSKYCEVRPRTDVCHSAGGFAASDCFHLHTLKITSGLEAIFAGFHRDCIQRKIRRAERERLAYQEGRSEPVLKQFYDLLTRTRRRHGVPPPPLEWFRNLINCLGESLEIRVVSKDGRPVASILTLRHNDTVVYKYGGFDEAFYSLGGGPFLLWSVIQDAKSRGLLQLDMGRTDCDNQGLTAFKDRLGALRTTLTYWRYPVCCSATRGSTWQLRLAKRICSRLPRACLIGAGRILYRHIG